MGPSNLKSSEPLVYTLLYGKKILYIPKSIYSCLGELKKKNRVIEDISKMTAFWYIMTAHYLVSFKKT